MPNSPAAQSAGSKVCLPFDKLSPPGPSYAVGDSFTEEAVTLNAKPFQWSDGTDFSGGKATQVSSNLAHGSLSKEMQLNNITLAADFSSATVQTLTVAYGEYGGNVNLWLNGSLANTNDFGDLDGTALGGVAIKVIPTTPEYGEIQLTGIISQFGIGGQELFIDDLCLDTNAIPNPNDPPIGVKPTQDLGDAPDSANHHSLSNTAYFFPASVAGKFPTTFDAATAPPAQGQGPLHGRTDVFWLGPAVTGEKEADLMPDTDSVTNILALSSAITTPTDLADMDRADDGWLNRTASFAACQTTVLQVQVSRSNIPISPTTFAYLNIWRDGNRDGDWQDTVDCPGGAGQTQLGYEWIGQNVPINVGAIAAGGSITVPVTTALVMNTVPTPTHWLRFTLSEERVLPPSNVPSITLPDGRGPSSGHKLGETEDYLGEFIPPPQEDTKIDLGDAPDSVQNHWPNSPQNTAYVAPATQGRYPTVWNSAAPGTDPSGPRHRNQQLRGWLGNGITWETEADINPDQDIVNNIKTAGADSSNRDVADDGWLNPFTNFPNCGVTTLRVRVRRSALALPPNTLFYLNTWFDGNRDGDWKDIGECPANPTTPPQRRWEWIVQNFAVNIAAIPVNGFVDLNVPTRRILNDFPQQEHWVRFTLSEAPVGTANGTFDLTLIPPRADGRGPQFPNEWRQGETEDYIYKPHLQGEPGTLRIRKTLNNPFGINTGGQVITYAIELDHIGGALAATTTLTDPLPPQVVPVGLPIVTNPIPAAGPLAASLVGNLITWNGWLNPNSRIRIEQPVKVKPCWGNGIRITKNTAYALQTATAGGGLISDTVTFDQKCIGLPWDVVTWTLKLDQPAVVPGMEVSATLTFSNTGREDVALRTFCCTLNGLPPGEPILVTRTLTLAPEATEAEQTCLPNDGELVKVPAGGAVSLRRTFVVPHILEGKPRIAVGDIDGDGIADDGSVSVEARFRPAFFDVFADALPIEPDELARICRRAVAVVPLVNTDLGDAPDSTNHFGAAMTAYPATPASYPSVFDPGTGAPSGPIHHRPQHFHLGKRVSVERDADLFPDQDAPFTNLRPPADVKDRDRWDDGVGLSAIKFQDCQQTKLPVQVFMDPFAQFYLTSTQSSGYINVWIDSNRDGDWADVSQCPSTTGVVAIAPEHIVINYQIPAGSLALGLNNISVPTGLVKWLAADAAKPAWLRVTLTTRPITLPLNAGSTNYSDGRGTHYRLGETEDYLYRESQKKPADVWIKKDGRVTGAEDSAAEISWVITVGNDGEDDAPVQVRDTVPAGWSVARIRVIGPDMEPDLGITSDRKGWDGTIKGSSAIRIMLVMTRTNPFDPNGIGGPVLVTNTATVTSTTDTDPSNNTATAVVTLASQLRPPKLVGPGDGTICTGTFTVTGYAQAGVTVQLYVDGLPNGSTTAAANGSWQILVSGLADGSHSLYAVAKVGAQTSSPSNSMVVIVDSTLTYSPLSLRFTEPDGSSHRPLDANGRTDDGGWQLRLKPNTTYTISVQMCCEGDPNASIEVRFGPTDTVALSDPDGDDVWEGIYTTPGRSVSTMVISCLCKGIIRNSDGTVLIDPYGDVTDANTSALLSGATVTAFEAQGTAYNPWNAAAFNQINPQVTLANGFYSFFTPPGTYQIKVTKAGYQQHRSADIVVTNQLVRYDVALVPNVSAAVTHYVALTENGPEPALLKLKSGSVVQFVNAVPGNNTVRSNRGGFASSNALRPEVANATNFDSGVLATGEGFTVKFDEKGTFTYENGQEVGTIVVEDSGTRMYLPLIRK
jgi:plastocyanin